MLRRTLCRVTAALLVASSTLLLAPPSGCATSPGATTGGIASEPSLLGSLWAIAKAVWVAMDSDPRPVEKPPAEPASDGEEPPAEPPTIDMSPHADPNG